jgi:hypothetical protein
VRIAAKFALNIPSILDSVSSERTSMVKNTLAGVW